MYNSLWPHGPDSSIHGISQASNLEWVAISFSRRYSWPRNRTHISCSAGGFFTTETPGKPALRLSRHYYRLTDKIYTPSVSNSKSLFYGWTNKCQDWGEALLELPLSQWFLQVDMHQKRPEGWLKYRLLGCTSRASYALGLGGTQEFAFFTNSRRCRCCWSRDHTWRAPHSKRKVWPTPKLSSVPRIAAASAVTINVLESF